MPKELHEHELLCDSWQPMFHRKIKLLKTQPKYPPLQTTKYFFRYQIELQTNRLKRYEDYFEEIIGKIPSKLTNNNAKTQSMP